jgi:hypothetical protein
MADGSQRSIEHIKVGEKVIAGDPTTGKTAARPVTATVIGSGQKQFVAVTVKTNGAGGKSTGTVVATDGHPFWVPARGWVKAAELHSREWLSTSASTGVQVTSVDQWTATNSVYNLTVAEFHTYHVAFGSTSVLVHNCGDTYSTVERSVEQLGRMRPSHGLDPAKLANLGRLSDRELLRAVNNPQNGERVLLTDDELISQGHHRIAELVRRAGDTAHGGIHWNTRVSVDIRWRDMSMFPDF